MLKVNHQNHKTQNIAVRRKADTELALLMSLRKLRCEAERPGCLVEPPQKGSEPWIDRWRKSLVTS